MKLAITALLLACMPFAASAEDAPSKDTILWGTFGEWKVFVDTSAGNACYVGRVYDASVVLRFGRYRRQGDSGLYMSVNNPKWKSLKNEQEYPVDVQFGDNDTWSGNALAVVEDDNITRSLVVSGADEKFLEEFETSDTAKVYYDDKEIANLSLKGVAKAVSEMNACQKKTDEVLKKLNPKPEEADPFAKKSPVGAADRPLEL
ncbi:hypothetical protein [Agrobacterium larrymoorei]|uniref:DUF2147 domain-containing protein n=1 Tax=Agrobacterium larrymoorei TaxID=160699 RepID=A0ABU0UPU1_9HYPH|nr:hypothetical protein [Agrobacterium larrymoorei]MDQ1186995.1 hypothetical protein [Agrobacterium larrymoorei]